MPCREAIPGCGSVLRFRGDWRSQPCPCARRSRRAGVVGADGRCADDAGLPTDAGAHQEAAFRRHELQDLGELGRQALGGQPAVGQGAPETACLAARARQAPPNLLLADPEAKGLWARIGRRRAAVRLFRHELGRFRVKGDEPGIFSVSIERNYPMKIARS